MTKTAKASLAKLNQAKPNQMLRPVAALALAGLALSACSNARAVLGLDRNAPDEFVVVSRAPLTLPPDMRALPTPDPGAPRPQEGTVTDQAQAMVFGGAAGSRRGAKSDAAATSGQRALLGQAGAAKVDPNIRRQVDQETTAMIIADESWVDSLLFWQDKREPSTMIDPVKESKRLRETQAKGGELDGGAVPTIERKRKAPLEGLF